MDNDAKNWWHEREDGIGITQTLDLDLLHRERSDYQLIEIFDHAELGRLLVLDGYIQACQADEFVYHEMAVHIPLLGRRRDRNSILIVGGGDGGILRECLRHDFVDDVTMVEIDHRVVELSRDYLGIEGNYEDPRVELVIGDARAFVEQTLDDARTYDIVILDLTEPVGPSAAIFTVEFCRTLARLIPPEGVVVDSDSLYLTMKGGAFLQEVSGGGNNLVSAMDKHRFLDQLDVYHTRIPTYPGADFGFFLYSHDGFSYRDPVTEFVGRHYNPDIHRAAFALPTWQRNWLMR